MKKFSKQEITDIMKNISPLIYIADETYREEFKQVFINDMPTSYIISSHGRLFNSSYHGILNNLRQMKTKHDKDNYEVCGIRINGKSKTVKIHRLVADAFIPKKVGKTQVNHINGKKFDNTVWNLEWVNNSENIYHALTTGLKIPNKGEDVYCSKYTEKDIIKICDMLLENKSFADIMTELNVPNYIVHFILRKKRWKHITEKYNFDDYYFGKDVNKIKYICELLETNKYTITEIAEITNSDAKLVYCILSGHGYKKISKHYDLSKFTNYKNKKV